MSEHQHPRLDRLVAVSVGGRPKGSGYLMDSRHVLTATHVLGTGEGIAVRRCGDEELWPAEAIWALPPKGGDVALLRLDRDVAVEGDKPQWASCGLSDREGYALGYPAFQDAARPKDRTFAQHDEIATERLRGRLDPFAGKDRQQLNFKYADASRPNADWRGFSGAALFVEGLLVGVVTHAHTDRALAWPAARLADDASLARAWKRKRLPLLTGRLWPEADQPLLRHLKNFTARTPATDQPSKLLDANYEVIKFVHRESELAMLESFATDEARDAVTVITGPGGAGKTRLMLEFCKRQRARGWLAGFLQRDLPDDLAPMVAGQHPRLVVLDYAEAEPKTAARVLRAMASRQNGPKMRVVMLARNDGPWLRAICRDDTAVADCVDDGRVHRLEPLFGTEEGRSEALVDARKQFRKVEREGAETSETPLHPPRSVRPKIEGRALYVHMQALLQAYGDADAYKLSEEQILDRILKHERRFWRRSLEKRFDHISDRLMDATERSAAAVVLCGETQSTAQSIELFANAPPTDTDESERNKIYDALFAVYGRRVSGAPHLLPMEPDLLGEKLLRDILSRCASGEVQTWLALPFADFAPGQSIGRALTVLNRLAVADDGRQWIRHLLAAHGEPVIEQALKTANARAPDPTGSTVAEAFSHLDDPDLAHRLSAAIPLDTVELRESAATASRVAVDLGRRRGWAPERLANALNAHGVSLSALGRREKALKVTREAVEMYRKLASERPELFLPKLAGTLHNLGTRLNKLGHSEKAIDATREAVELRERLAAQRPNDFLPDLAASQSNLGVQLHKAGERKEALKVTQAAVNTYQMLSTGQPDEFLPDLAGALTNLGIRLGAIGERAEAVEASRQGAKILLELASRHPDAFRPGLAGALNNLSIRLRDIGEQEEALQVARRALRIYRTLSADQPDAFLPELAHTLSNVGALLSEARLQEEALQATSEAVAIRRTLASDQPDAFLPELAGTLVNLGWDLADAGKLDDALKATEEAVTIHRSFASKRPDAFVPDLATSLGTRGSVFSAMGSHADAAACFEEGVRRLFPLAERHPEALGGLLLSLLSNFRKACKTSKLPIPDDLAPLVDQLP